MKKFLTRALPLCLALLIFVGSLAMPAFAAETAAYTINGTWVLKDDFPDIAYDDCFFDPVLINATSAGFDLAYLCIDYGDLWFEDSDCEFVGSFSDFVDCPIVFNTPALFDPDVYDFWVAYFDRVDAAVAVLDGNDVSIFSVFSGISGWIVSAIGTIMPMFYTEATGLTFIGTLAVAALALGVCFLIVALIRRFLNFS